MALFLTKEETLQIADKLNDLSVLFTGNDMDAQETYRHIAALRLHPLVEDFATLAAALELGQAGALWPHAGEMPTPEFIVDTMISMATE